MQLRRLRLQNFRQHADTAIELGQGITAIIGPNGAGKTTLLEAIGWALYGDPAARGNRDTIRRHGAPARSPVRVEVDFAFGAHELRVTRTLYDAELYQDRFDEPVARSQQEVTARVERLLGMTREEFFHTYFTGQKELAVLANLGPADRGRFLSRVLGYEKLRLAQDRMRDQRSALRGSLSEVERGLADRDALEAERRAAAARLAEAEATLGEMTRGLAGAREALEREGPQWTRMAELRERQLALDGDRRLAEQEVGEARRAFERLDREMAEALSARAKLDELAEALAEVEPLRAELDALEHQARAAGRRRVLAGQLRELQEQAERVEQRLRQLGDTDAALTAARAALAGAREELAAAEQDEERARTAWVRDRQDAETKRQSLREQYLDHQKHQQSVVDAGAEGTCPICRRPLGAEYEDVLATLANQLEEIEVKGKFFRRRLEQLQDPPPEVREAERRKVTAAEQVERAVQEVARCEDRARDRGETAAEAERLGTRRSALEEELAALPEHYDEERHDAVRNRLRELDPVVAKGAELRGKATRAEELVAEAERAERSLSACEARVRALEESIAALGFREDAFREARARYENAETAVREAELRVEGAKGDRRAAAAALDIVETRERERAERAERADALRSELRLHDELDRALADLRAELNAAMRPDLAERASEFLSSLTDGRYDELDLDETYQVMVVEDGQAKPVISGGEEDLTHLVLRLAISQMVAERAGQPLSLLVLDEIFGSLDEHRRHNVVQLLRGLADRFPQVVLITHIESVRDGVDRVLRVSLDPEHGAAVVEDDEPLPAGTDVAA